MPDTTNQPDSLTPAPTGKPSHIPAEPHDGTPNPPSGLTGEDRAILALESRSWPAPGPKERVIRERLGLSPTRYYQLLNALLDDPRALAHDPVTVNRLRRRREELRRRRGDR
ncbi:DUF3263 domain-containing protein [Streptomyces sp. HK10]|uniref:DUF3263 domain-containing protein n=1 Tax=Streptomyces sp. HK10 TaxID=3373255 RepID=UPI0037481169